MTRCVSIFALMFLPLFSAFSQTDYSVYTEKDWAKRKKIMKLLASPLKAALIVYRWGDLDEWDELGGKKNLPNKLTQAYWEKKMLNEPPGVSGMNYAGRGIYSSSNIYDSSFYANRNKGEVPELFKLKIKKGSQFINLADERTQRIMKKNKITNQDVYFLDPPAVVRYRKELHWYLIKIKQGVTFEKLSIDDFGGKSLKARINLRRKLFSDASRDIFDRYEKKFVKSSKFHAKNHKDSKRPWWKPSKGLIGKLNQGDVQTNLKEFLRMISTTYGSGQSKKVKKGKEHSKKMKEFYEKVSNRYKLRNKIK
ncbi:hypothetical protein OAK75_04605 [Bacteriovoracales bacterium]|nr:hypothetical protein [Bacteriovoracales bacterium]